VADVTNYTIENASGANVRTDLNAVFGAIQSSNSKSTDLTSSQCVAGMPFLNTTSKILKIRNSSNGAFTEIGNIDQANLGLLSKSGGTMTGQLLLDDLASATSPALSFDTDTDLGLFRQAANIMGFSSAGTEAMFFSGDGITLKAQNEIRFSDSDSSHYVSVSAPASVSSNRTVTLPDAGGVVVTSETIVDQVNNQDLTGMRSITPVANNVHNLGSTTLRWANLFVNDFNLSNEGHKNDVDGTWGSYTIQEGVEDLFLINQRNGKKYKFVLQEVS